MPIFWLIIALAQLGSLIFCLFAIYRLNSYIRVYRFDESHYTLLLGFIHLKWISTFYIIYTTIFILITTLIILAVT